MTEAKEAALPPLYGKWLREVTGGAIPEESKATCEQCAMLPSPGSPADAAYFHAGTKCCAFRPDLPNYLAGRILSDDGPGLEAGRSVLESRIRSRVSVKPDAVGAGAIFPLLYQNTPNVFGRAPALRCYYLGESGGCGIWNHRPSVCATWFCKHVRGLAGFHFWRLAHKLLTSVEQDLELWCMAELKAGLEEVAEAMPTKVQPPDVSELEGEIDWVRYRKLWGRWAGREAQFYRECAKLVDKLSWADVEGICGPRVRILAGLLRDTYIHLQSSALPERLRLGQVNVTGTQKSSYRIVSYSSYDPLILPEALARSLQYFDGRPTEEALQAILTEQKLRIPPELVRKMVDFGMLVAHDPSAAFPILG
jgi:hypothetical protein